MNKSVLRFPVTPTFCLVLLGGGFVMAGYNMVGMTIIGLAFVILLIQNLRFRSVGPVGLAVLGLLIVFFLAPAFVTLTGEPDADELAIQETSFQTVCPTWNEQNLFGRYVTYRDRAWCSAYEDRNLPMTKAPVQTDGEATGSASISSNPSALWK
ncbi:hypothetical protein HFO91_30280 [Rhizobium leguminosarum]|uniref:hypothetical protein n=1 Tax=Rhizobium leguminosarum TaxID=384 RepID=UPI001C93D5F3|nr:hypothetical protein [Rhizobium leguminosarum]MBY5453867.1 hypothetical protein [Rhizobium leguminosarum]